MKTWYLKTSRTISPERGYYEKCSVSGLLEEGVKVVVKIMLVVRGDEEGEEGRGTQSSLSAVKPKT
jgi:hypothetical protein